MVDCTGLENRHGLIAHRGFESGGSTPELRETKRSFARPKVALQHAKRKAKAARRSFARRAQASEAGGRCAARKAQFYHPLLFNRHEFDGVFGGIA